MEQNNHKFRLRLNLFDCAVILIALVAAGFLLWNRFKPTPAAIPDSERVRYTICLQKVIAGVGDRVEAGDQLVDAVKNFSLGSVVSVEVRPATDSIIDEGQRRYVTTEIPGYEDLLIQVESTATITEEKVLVGSGYAIHVGEDIYVRGPGYLGSGEVYAIERGN